MQYKRKIYSAVKRVGENARWADLTIRLVVTDNRVSARKRDNLPQHRLKLPKYRYLAQNSLELCLRDYPGVLPQ